MSATTLSGFFEQWWFAIIGFPMMLAFMVFSYRRQGNAKDEFDKFTYVQSRRYTLIGYTWFIVMVAAFLWSPLYGWRIAGLGSVGWGVWCIVVRRISYGIEGFEPAGYMSGVLAISVGLIGIVVGCALMFIPEMFDPSLEIRTR